MSAPERIAQLRTIQMFAALPDDALERLAQDANDFEAPAGQVLIQPNEPGNGVFILTEGTATVEVAGTTIEVGPGECIGELSLILDDVVHTARVRAATTVRGVAISREPFVTLLESDPRIAGVVLRVLARRLVAADRRLARS
jgi:CRP-like cAMP-binding protein